MAPQHLTKARRAALLRRAITRSLRKQGFDLQRGVIRPPGELDKTSLRALHRTATSHKLAEAAPSLKTHEDRLLQLVASGRELSVENLRPKIVPVEKGTEHALLFRYIQLHWSIPVSNGYGRRLRFIVLDEANGKVMGIIGLGDPVYSLKARDEWIGWSGETKRRRLYHVMDAYVLGAVPPYSYLLGSKLMALLALSSEVQTAFRSRYKGRRSLMSNLVRPPYLALLTTSSALGRSSVYNRLKTNGIEFWRPLGYTSGSGDFQFANGLYARIREFANDYCAPTAKVETWGVGFRNRREVIGKCLRELGLSDELKYHHVQREVFAAECGSLALPFLRGETSTPNIFERTAADLFAIFRDRWLLPRSQRVHAHLAFTPEQYRLWPPSARGRSP
jgi:hypothetical protein